MQLLLAAFLVQCLCIAPGLCSGKEGMVVGKDDTALRKFAVSVCLAESYKGGSFEQDALKAAGGYFEKSTRAADLFMDVQVFAEKWAREKAFTSKHGSDLSVMKCLDLYENRDLTALLEKQK